MEQHFECLPPGEALEKLLEMHDTDPVFLSVTHPINSDGRFFRKRSHAILDALDGCRARKVMEENVSLAERYMEKHGGEAYYLFVSVPHDLFLAVTAPPEIKEPRMVADTSPYIRDLAEAVDDWEPYLLVFVEEGDSVVEIVDMGRWVSEEKVVDEIMNRHRKGGMSQRRFQRLREEAVHRHLVSVAEAVKEAVADSGAKRLIIAGPGESKKEFLKVLPADLKNRVVGVVDTDALHHGFERDRGDEQVLDIFLKSEFAEENRVVQKLARAIMEGGGVYGGKDVARAVVEGRVSLLVVLHGTTMVGWRCENCGMIGAGTGIGPGEQTGVCPVCGSAVVRVDLVEECVEEALKMGGGVEFVHDSPYLEKLGGMAGFLRY